LFLREDSPLAGWRLSEGSARGSRRKQLFSERPSGSFTSGGFPKEANLFRFLRLPPEGRASFGFLKEARLPSAAFGKLHLWRGGGFPKEANLFPSFGFLPKEGRPPEGRASSRRKGVLREASPLAGWRFLRKASPLAASFGKTHVALRRKLDRPPLESRSTICFPKDRGALVMVIFDHHQEA